MEKNHFGINDARTPDGRKQTYRRDGGMETRLSMLCLVQQTNGVVVNRINFVNKKRIDKKTTVLIL